MSGKQAKKLRKLALGLAVHHEETTGHRLRKVEYDHQDTTLVCKSDSFRGIVKHLKKALK
jgi:hypothetical protein